MRPDLISAVVVTRGNVDLTDVLAPLACFAEVIVWDNSARADLGVFGRYTAIFGARCDHIYVQDDDCVVPAAELAAMYDGDPLVSMSENRWNEYTDSVLVGWGAIFPRSAPWKPFLRYWDEHGSDLDATFRRCCDVIFTAQTEWTRVDLGHHDLPWATDSDRMCMQPVHYGERARVLERCRALRQPA